MYSQKAPAITIIINLTDYYWYHKSGVCRGWFFKPGHAFDNNYDLFLCSPYGICIIFTNGIDATIKMGMRCAWDAGKIRDTDYGWTADRPLLLYGKIFSRRAGTCHR